MSSVGRITLHLFGVSFVVFAILYDQFFVNFEPIAVSRKIPYTSFGGKLKYLTVWNMYVLLSFVFWSLWCDLKCDKADVTVKENVPSNKYLNIRDYMFAALAYPLSLFVSSTFWILYAVNRELVFPRILDGVVPVWLNHLQHTLPLLYVCVEMAVVKHRCPRTLSVLFGNLILVVAYLSWMLLLAFYKDFWVYPILQVLPWPGKVTFVMACSAYSLLTAFIGIKVNQRVWGRNDNGQSEERGHANGINGAAVMDKSD